MARPLRIEFAGALYHVTSRGDGQEAIFLDRGDRNLWLEVMDSVCERFNWLVHAYCQMGNHYHILLETPDANLSKGMRQLNGVFTQRFNRRHHRVGHVFQGRYKAILVEKDAYLLELARYIVLNPVRARMVGAPDAWPWSNYRATAGLADAPPWLETDWIVAAFAARKGDAQATYRRFVAEGVQRPSPWEELKNQIYLGSDTFVEAMQSKIDADRRLSEIPKTQRRPVARPLSWYLERYPDRDTAIVEAFASGSYSMREIGDQVSLHYSTISRIVRRSECARDKT
jgi:REP element-mobilizing transposase RayT